ncbi:hypothetical protein DSO57_1000356 [Entomophthora muscae]|uniref:Uncharacterized protein n=1 Tax=Entomophthora muscae TaxID=34485 RepID=A0ACC2TKQ6_9FUNG|nr:hypothetical protein DSO57_1000356 [Entomophthora muscae]
MTPQIYANWKLKNASSLSPGYVILSLVGNLLSCTGAILGGLIFTSILVTGYLSLLGFVLLYQTYIYRIPEDDISTNIGWRVAESEQECFPQPRSIRSRLSFLPTYEPTLSMPDHDMTEDHRRHPPNMAVENFELPRNAILPGSYSEASPLLGPFDGSVRDNPYTGNTFTAKRSQAASILSARSSIFSQTINHYVQKKRASILSNRPNSILSTKTKRSLHRMSVMSTFTYPPTAPPPSSDAQSSAIVIGLVAVATCVTLLVKFSPSSTSIIDHLMVPQTLGWLAGFLFVVGRCSQLHKNYSRKSVEGLSVIMFAISILGNINYLLALVLFSSEKSYLLFNLPWLVGGIAGLLLDVVVVFQFILYQDNCIPYDALPAEDVEDF